MVPWERNYTVMSIQFPFVLMLSHTLNAQGSFITVGGHLCIKQFAFVITKAAPGIFGFPY